LILPNRFAEADCRLLSQTPLARCYQMRHQGQVYFVRQAIGSHQFLGIDQYKVQRLQRLAADAGLAPALHYVDPHSGLFVSQWLGEDNWGARDLSIPQLAQALGTLAARLHGVSIAPLPQALLRLDVGLRLQHYLSRICRRDPRITSCYHQARHCLAQLPAVPWVLCHHDLHPGNLLGDAPWLVDWEYAALGDPAFELALCWVTNDLDGAAGAQLLAAYQAAGGQVAAERVALLLPVARLLVLLWAQLLWERFANETFHRLVVQQRQRLFTPEAL